MPFYIAPYIGAGTMRDPFRPRASDGQAWSAIDFRVDATRSDGGRALLYLPMHDPDPQLNQFSDEAVEPVTLSSRRRLARSLGNIRQPEATQFDDIVFDLLFPLTAPRSGMCPPIKLGRQRKWIVTCGPLRIERSAIGGGVTLQESFTTGDSGTLGGDQTWVVDAGDVDIVSNRARHIGGAASVARVNSNLGSDDHYVQAKVSTNDASDAQQAAGVITRKVASSTLTFYMADVHWLGGSSNVLRLFRCSSGGFTSLATSSALGAIGDTTQYLLRLEVDGSLLDTLFDGVAKHVDVTDSNITGNLQCGIRGDANATGSYVEWDDWEAGDIVVGGGGDEATQFFRRRR